MSFDGLGGYFRGYLGRNLVVGALGPVVLTDHGRDADDTEEAEGGGGAKTDEYEGGS